MSKLKFLTAVVLLLVDLSLIQCGGIAGISTSTTGGGAEDSGDTVDTGTTIDSLGDTESGLYEDGPVDLPVTIAKLDSVNLTADNDATYLTSSEGLLMTPQRMVRQAETSSEAGYRFTFGADSIKEADRELIKYIAAINTETGDIQYESVNADGSVDTFTVPSTEGQLIAIVPMPEDQSVAGIPIFPFVEDGVYGNVLTNAEQITPHMPVVILDNYTFFSEKQDADGTFKLFRRHLDGREVELMAEGIAGEIRFIAPESGGSMAFFRQDGKAFYLKVTSDSTWGEPELIRDLGQQLDNPENFVPASASVFASSNGYIFVANRRMLNQTEESQMSEMLAVYNTTDKTTTLALPTTEYRDATFDVGAPNELFVFVAPINTSQPEGHDAYELYRLDMTLGHDAWENRTLIYTLPGSENRVVSLNVSTENLVVFATANNEPGMMGMLALDDLEHPLPTVLFENRNDDERTVTYSEFVAASPGGSFGNSIILTCGQEEDSENSYLAIHRFGLDARNQLFRISNTQTKNGCAGAYNIDDEGRIVYFQAMLDPDTGEELPPQLTLIDLIKIDPDLIVLDE